MTPTDSPSPARLEDLLVIDCLEVGPARIEPDKVTMPYRVTRGDVEESIDFIYKYDEPVFDADEPSSRNLAHMLGAQVAINYGLFCRSIVFNGLFDENDRRFILDMLENTCREIYVKKFMQPNPYIGRGEVGMKFEKRDRYLQAEVEFPNIPESGRRARWKLWATDRDRHLVLSSGGKDSLLTYGLLSEMGKTCYPVFANESGRHWFTALNAFRYFKEHVPGTGRVWVNSDRVFAFMLRQLSFVRPDFADVRADEYAIRLWTVAVFLFGVLPIMRKHGLGRVVIGDEYDTTNRVSFEGLTHYDGLFDQSRYFDNTLSQYYLRKGWSISQFSILRPLSEILIEKVLVERYPALQAMQVSCHAAHTEDGRVLPCGKCEKCRRIVAMLVAVDADPRHCGYTDEQIAACLDAVATEGIHQEAEGVAHLHYLLDQKGRVTFPSDRKKRLKPRPEVMCLRYDNRRSPLTGTPVDLRRPFISMVLEHADGALLRSRRRWVEFDPLRDPGMETPYAYEVSTTRGGDDSRTSRMRPAAYLWGEMTWPEAEEVFQDVDVAILPVGAIEQHGPHLPLDTDSYDADYLARRVAAACSDPKPLVLPLVAFGVSYHHEDFAGTVSVRNETLAQFVYDVGAGVARNGIQKLVILNGHGGNEPALNHAAQMINRDTHIFVCVDTGETSDVDIYDIIDTPNDVHAGEIETSTSLAIRPHLVRTKEIEKSVPSFSSRYLDMTSQRGVPWHAHTHKISSSGVMGDPTKATAEKGRRIWQIQIAHLVALVEDLKRMTLEEIYQRRY